MALLVNSFHSILVMMPADMKELQTYEVTEMFLLVYEGTKIQKVMRASVKFCGGISCHSLLDVCSSLFIEEKN